MGQFIELSAADGFKFPAWVAEPAGAPKGAVVVLQEIFGVNAHIRDVSNRYAAEGYLAVAPATFQRVAPDAELAYDDAGRGAGMAHMRTLEALPAPGVLQDVQAAIEYAARGGKVGIVGYCWGGLLAWRAACTLDGLAAAVPYYGGGMTRAEESARHPRVPVLAHFGSKDPGIPLDGIEAFKTRHPEVEVHLYDCGHAFNRDADPHAYHAEAARLAWQRTRAFFAKHLA